MFIDNDKMNHSLKTLTIEQSICQLNDDEKVYLLKQLYLSLPKIERLKFLQQPCEINTIVLTQDKYSVHPRNCKQCNYFPDENSDVYN